MPQRKTILLLVWLLSCLALPAAADSGPSARLTLDLEAAVQRGLEMNPGLAAARHEIEAAEAHARSVRGELFPRLTATAGERRLHNLSDDEYNQDYLDQRSTTYSVRLSQPLFAGFTIMRSWQRAGLQEDLSRAREKMRSLDLAYQIQRNFLEILRVREDLRAARAAVERLDLQMEAAEAWFAVEMRPRLGVLQTRAELEEARNRVISLDNAEQTLVARLNALLAFSAAVEEVEYADHLLTSPPTPAFNLQDGLVLARENRPDLVMAAKAVEIARNDRAGARGQFAPRVSLDMDYTNQDLRYQNRSEMDLNREHWSVGINMQWELFSGGRNYYAAQSSGRELDRSLAEEREVRLQAEAEVRSAFLAHEDAEARISGAREAVAAAREAFKAAEVRYRGSLGTTTEVLDTQSQLTRAETVLNQARVDKLLALAEIYRAVGMLNPGLK